MEMKDVIILITGSQSIDGEDEKNSLRLLTDGKYGFTESESVLTYMESELTGLEGTETRFTVGREAVVMSRAGKVNSRMVFEKGKKHTFIYETAMGSATMGVNTHAIKTLLGEHGGDMEIDYVVDVDHTVVGHNKFKIQVMEPEGGKVRWQI